jgi:hypothetical protein
MKPVLLHCKWWGNDLSANVPVGRCWTLPRSILPKVWRVWRQKQKLFRIKIGWKTLWESFHTSTHTYFFGRKDAVWRYDGSDRCKVFQRH